MTDVVKSPELENISNAANDAFYFVGCKMHPNVRKLTPSKKIPWQHCKQHKAQTNCALHTLSLYCLLQAVVFAPPCLKSIYNILYGYAHSFTMVRLFMYSLSNLKSYCSQVKVKEYENRMLLLASEEENNITYGFCNFSTIFDYHISEQ